MLLQIGEIAAKAGLTVRTLHHYEAIGLLRPASRSDAGYRLYNAGNLERLLQIRMLRHSGLKLEDIRTVLDGQQCDIAALIGNQIASLTQQITQMSALKTRLCRVQARLADGSALSAAEYLSVLEMISMYENYFSQQELANLPLYARQDLKEPEWKARVAAVAALMARQIPPSDPQAQQAGAEWMCALERDTDSNPDFFVRLNQMHLEDEATAVVSGIEPAMVMYVAEAFSESQLALFRPFLTPEQYKVVAARYFESGKIWPALIADLHLALTAGDAPSSAAAQDIVRRWLAMFTEFTGGDTAIQAQIRTAYQSVPQLSQGSWMTPARREFLVAATEIFFRNMHAAL